MFHACERQFLVVFKVLPKPNVSQFSCLFNYFGSSSCFRNLIYFVNLNFNYLFFPGHIWNCLIVLKSTRTWSSFFLKQFNNLVLLVVLCRAIIQDSFLIEYRNYFKIRTEK